jgi:hypothetical protein
LLYKKQEVSVMPLEGHPGDCDCGCCDVEEEPQVKAEKKNVCPACGKEMPAKVGSGSAAGKCPVCGMSMQPGA